MPREKMAGVEGVEPSHTAPETAVLPLDDTPNLHFASVRYADIQKAREPMLVKCSCSVKAKIAAIVSNCAIKSAKPTKSIVSLNRSSFSC